MHKLYLFNTVFFLGLFSTLALNASEDKNESQQGNHGQAKEERGHQRSHGRDGGKSDHQQRHGHDGAERDRQRSHGGGHQASRRIDEKRHQSTHNTWRGVNRAFPSRGERPDSTIFKGGGLPAVFA